MAKVMLSVTITHTEGILDKWNHSFGHISSNLTQAERDGIAEELRKIAEQIQKQS